MTDSEQFRSESSDGLALSVSTVPGLLTSRLANGCSTQSGRAVVSASASDDDPAEHGDTGLIVAPDKPKLAKPPLWKVVMLNDDYTPMEFVVEVLQTFFGMNGEGDADHVDGSQNGQRHLRYISQGHRRDQVCAGQSVCARESAPAGL